MDKSPMRNPQDKAKEYGYDVNKKAYLPDEKLFTEIPAAAEIKNLGGLTNAQYEAGIANERLKHLQTFNGKVDEIVEKASELYKLLDEKERFLGDSADFNRLKRELLAVSRLKRTGKGTERAEDYKPIDVIVALNKLKTEA